MKRKRITRLPVPDDAKSTDNEIIKSSKFSKNLGPQSTDIQKSENIQKEDTESSNMNITELVKSKPLCFVEGTTLKNSESNYFKQSKAVVGTEDSKDTVTKQLSNSDTENSDTESSEKGLEMSTITVDRASEFGKVPNFPTSANFVTTSIAGVEETDVKTARKSEVASVKEHAGNIEYLNDLETASGGNQETLCFMQSETKLDSENLMQDAEKVLVVEMKQGTESDKTALQNSPKSTKILNSSKSISEMDNNNQDKIMLVAKSTSDILLARDIEIKGKVESSNDSATDTEDVQNCHTKPRKYFTLGTQKLHEVPMGTSTECVNDVETVLDDIRRDKSNIELKIVDDSSEKLDDDYLPASPFRPAIIDFNTTLPCSPDPQNPMLKNLVDSVFCSPLKGSRSRLTTADDKQAVNSMGHLNGSGDMAGKGTLSTQNTDKFSGSDNEFIPLSHKHLDDCSVEQLPRVTVSLPKNCVDDADMDVRRSSSHLSSESLNKAETETFYDENVVVSNSCGNEITNQIPSVSLSGKNIAYTAEEVSKVNHILPNKQVNMITHGIGSGIRNSKTSKEETSDTCNKLLMDPLQDMVDSALFLESGVGIMTQPVDCSQDSSTADNALYLNNIDMKAKNTTDTNKVCETIAERIGNEKTDQKTVAVLQGGCSKTDVVEPDSENCFGLENKQEQNDATDGNDHLSESEYCVHNSFDEIENMLQSNGGLELELNQTKDASLMLADEVMENISFEQNLDHSVDFPYCSCAETQQDSSVPIEQIFVHEGQMYQLSHANIVRFGNLEFYAFLRDDSLHIPLGNFFRVVDKEVRNIFRSAVKFERLQLPCLTLDEMYLLEQKCGVYYDSTNISLISLVTLQEICVLLLNIYPDSMTLKMLAFSKPCQRTLGSQLRCSVCGLSKHGKHPDKTYVPVNPTGDQNPKVEATVGALTIGDKNFTAFKLKDKVYMSLKNIFQEKLVKLKTLQNRLKKLSSRTIIAPMEIEEYFGIQGEDVDHTLWIDMVTLRCVICMGKLSTPELIRIAQGEFIYNPSYYLFCEDTSRSDVCFEVNSGNGELIQMNFFKGACKRLPLTLTKGRGSLAERIKDDSNENVDTHMDDSGLINGTKYRKIIQTGRKHVDKNSGRPRKSCRPRKKKTSSDMFYYFDENKKLQEYDRENESDQTNCKDGAKKQCQFKKESSREMKNTSQDSDTDGQIILKPGDYIVRNYEKFYEKLDAGYIVGKGNDNKLIHLQSEENKAANSLESEKDIDDRVQQFSDGSSKQGNNLGLNLDFKFFETKESTTKTDNTDDTPVEAKGKSAFDEENKVKNCASMSSENQGSLNNELNQAVAMSNPSSEDLQNFIDRFSTLDSDTVKNLKLCDVSLTPTKNKVNLSADSVTECSEEETDFYSVQQFKESQINEVEEVDNCIQFVTGNNCIRPESVTDEFSFAEELRKHSVTIEEHLIKANIPVCVQKEENDIGKFKSDLHDRIIADVEDNDLICSVKSVQVSEIETEKPNGLKGIGHRQCEQDIIEQSEPEAVTQEKIEDVCNNKEEKYLTLEDRTQNMQNPPQNVGIEKCEIEMAEIQPEQKTDADKTIGKTVEEMRREMEDNIRKYLVFMYVKEGDQPGFRVKNFKEGAEKVFPTLFVPDPEHLETKLKRMKFMKAAAKYMDGLFHRHTHKLLEKKMKMSETSSVGSSAFVNSICESSTQSTCYENTVEAKSDKVVEDKCGKVTGLLEICTENNQVDNNKNIFCETKDKFTSHNKYDERQNRTPDSCRKIDDSCYESKEMLNCREKSGRRQIYTTDNSKEEGLKDQCQTTSIIIKTAENDSEIGKKEDDLYLEVTSKTGDNNQETSNVNECKSLYTDSNMKYSTKSVTRCGRKRTSKKGTSTTSSQEQRSVKKPRLDNDVSLVERNEPETMEGRLTRARKRIISQKQESIDKLSHLEKPVQNLSEMSNGETSTGLLKEDKTVVPNKIAIEETKRDKDIKSGGDDIQNSSRRITRQSRVNFDLKTSVNNSVSEFSEMSLKEKELVSSKQQVKCKKKQNNFTHTDKPCFDQSFKNEKQGNACMSDCIIRLRENRKNTKIPMPVTSKRKNKNIIMFKQDTLNISECHVKLNRIRLLDDAVTS